MAHAFFSLRKRKRKTTSFCIFVTIICEHFQNLFRVLWIKDNEKIRKTTTWKFCEKKASLVLWSVQSTSKRDNDKCVHLLDNSLVHTLLRVNKVTNTLWCIYNIYTSLLCSIQITSRDVMIFRLNFMMIAGENRSITRIVIRDILLFCKYTYQCR